jgi:hypothetical protein
MSGVLAASVRVVQYTLWRLPVSSSHLQSPLDQRLVHILVHCPAHHTPGANIEHSRQVKPAFFGRNVGDVSQPFLIGPLG